MSFRELKLETEYRTGQNNVVKDFYMPLLSDAVLYKRAVGFFSSTALIQISKGIADLVKNGGRIQLIASPRLSEEDIDAITKGYDSRKIIEEALLKSFVEPRNVFESERLNLLATLIANDKLDIKIAFTQGRNQIGIYHEKMGLFYDKDNNIVAFSGSVNETEMAFTTNYEVMDVFCSWQSDFEKKKVEEKEFAFHKLWTNADSSISIIDFPKVAAEKLQSYRQEIIDFDIDKKEQYQTVMSLKKNKFFEVPPGFKFHEYQQQAIDSWLKNDGCGIFDMATGSGKTYTALGALCQLSSEKDSLAVVIVCPYQHLVEQWLEDIKMFNVNPLVCYSKYDWKKEIKLLAMDFKLKIKKKICIVCTNATFALKEMQDALSHLKGNLCIVVDEAHNVGSQRQLTSLPGNFSYRLGLSATIERHRDEDGTHGLFDYFGNKCIEFSLKDAIDNKFLTPYKYYPVLVTLDIDELEEYTLLTEKIKSIMSKLGTSDGEIPKTAEMLLIKRARLVAGARNKIPELIKQINPYKNKNNLLIYCGATKFDADGGIDDNYDNTDNIRQIEKVCSELGENLKMKVHKFTSKENAVERQQLKESFSKGDIQALVAIKCLDEGVNIPGITTAFILASSTNPKEYIQRRGRVLRKAEGKEIAEIYDFVVMPRPLNEAGREFLDVENALIKREFERMNDFVSLCMNPSVTYQLMDMIKDNYKINIIGDKDYGI